MADNALSLKFDFDADILDEFKEELQSAKGVKAGYFKDEQYPSFTETHTYTKEKTGETVDITYTKEAVPIHMVAFWNEYGTVAQTSKGQKQWIPPRPFMQTACDDIAEWQAIMEDALRQGTTFEKVCGLIGEAMRNSIIKQILSDTQPENAELTKNGGWGRNKKTGKVFWTDGKKGSGATLRNTGKLMESVHHEVIK